MILVLNYAEGSVYLESDMTDQEKKACQCEKPLTIWSLGWLLIKLYVAFHVILFALGFILVVLGGLLGAY